MQNVATMRHGTRDTGHGTAYHNRMLTRPKSKKFPKLHKKNRGESFVTSMAKFGAVKVWHVFLNTMANFGTILLCQILLPLAMHLEEGRGTTILELPRLENCISRLCPSPLGSPPPPHTPQLG